MGKTCMRAFVSALIGMTLVSFDALGQVSVSSSGSPSYSQTIAVPPGIAGMSPNLSLTYVGGGINGPVGNGWSIQGLSAITRCPANKRIDGKFVGVSYSPSDKLCLDGQRLIQTDLTGLAVTQIDDARGLATGYREYRTAKDSYARIRAYGIGGPAGSPDTNGPAYFRVWTKAGQIYDYGAAPTADLNTKASVSPYGKTVVMAWAVARVTDAVGNYIDFKYEQRDMSWGSGPTAGTPTYGHEWNILEIQYTGNVAQVATNKVIFRYGERMLDRAETYHQGSKNVSIRRLDRIETYIKADAAALDVTTGNPVKVRSVILTYDNGPISQRSRLTQITECTGAATPVCQPPTQFTYAPGSDTFTANVNFTASALATTTLMNSAGTMGLIPIDYDGDGKTDFIRWSDIPTQNVLYRSVGDGTFTSVVGFNLTSQNLFSSDGCYQTMVADFNGDGIPDLLRTVNVKSKTGVACASRTHILFLSQGNGTFTSVPIPSSIVLDKIDPVTTPPGCPLGGCTKQRTQGSYYYVLDVDGDGILDIVTTILPAYTGFIVDVNSWPTEQTLCSTVICSHIYKGGTLGTFTEVTTTNIAHRSLERLSLQDTSPYSFTRSAGTGDVNGDGLTDIFAGGGAWISTPNGVNLDFTQTPVWGIDTCSDPIDFNGDGRADCLYAQTGLTTPYNQLWPGTGDVSSQTATFNLLGPAIQLIGAGVGYQAADVNGDGRTDILRWADTVTSTILYVSNGDGSFSPSATFNLNTTNTQLKKSDGTSDYLLGDFLGIGSLQILRLKHLPSVGAATSNQLYVKNDTLPIDQLLSVMSPLGLKTTVTYASLANDLAGHYSTDRGVAGVSASYPVVDLTVPVPVVVATETDTGVGVNKVKTEFAYRGLKAAYDGRGWLGFRQTVQQNVAPNGEALSVWTTYRSDPPYAGAVSRTQTLRGAWNNAAAQVLSTTINVYCDTTSTNSPGLATETTPCVTPFLVTRPYLRQSVESGSDLGGIALPTVTTTNGFNSFGDPTDITVVTAGSVAGLSNQIYTKATANTYCTPDTNQTDGSACPNKISGDNWIIGRLVASKVTSTVPDLLASIAASAGTPVDISAQAASLTPTVALGAVTVGANATATATLVNIGTVALSITVPTATSVSGTDFSFVSTTCTTSLAPAASCTVTVKFLPTAAVTRTGALTVNTGGGTMVSSLTGTGVAAPNAVLTESPTTLAFGTVAKTGIKTLTMTITNTTAVAANGMNYAFAGATITKGAYLRAGGTCPAAGGVLAGNANCTVIVEYDGNCVAGANNATLTTTGTNFTSLVTTLTATTSSAGACP